MSEITVIQMNMKKQVVFPKHYPCMISIYLLGVYDECRIGALRFKTDLAGPSLDDNAETPTPPWSSIRELQHAADNIEDDSENTDVKKWLAILMAPGSSLGGARPKANISDEEGSLWIAKFPSRNDNMDKAAWESCADCPELTASNQTSRPHSSLPHYATHQRR